MEVVVAMLALEYGVITDTVFVAIVCGAVVSSLIAGPWMRWALSRSPRLALLRFFSRDAIIAELKAADMEGAIERLCDIAARHEGVGTADELLSAVLAREKTMSTALEDGVAVPHARMDAVQRPLVVVARSRTGIQWNSPDGKPAHFIFLILTPPGADEPQVTILRGIASAMGLTENRKELEDARDEDQMWAALQEILEPEREPEVQGPT